MIDMALEDLGWNGFFESQRQALAVSGRPGRIMEEHRIDYRVLRPEGEVRAVLPGHFRHHAKERQALPAVGDWVLLEDTAGGGPPTIRHIFERRTRFSRKSVGVETREQVLAANVDVAFVVQSFEIEMNPRRIERYLAVVLESGAAPVVLLNKADLVEDPAAEIERLRPALPAVDLFAVSALEGIGITELRERVSHGRTAALLGPSGAGKSTLLNRLYGNVIMDTQEVRERDAKGRHTTTSRQLVLLPGGGLVLDTPGLREIHLWEAEEGLSQIFENVEELAAGCQFRDCVHQTEPGCAVRQAVEQGRITSERWQSFVKLKSELKSVARSREERTWSKGDPPRRPRRKGRR
jgi:ribosome biogenesis GTPase